MPRFYRDKIEQMLVYSGSKRTPENYINRTLAVSIAISIIASAFFMDNFLPAFAISFIASFAMLHGLLILAVDKRSKFVEGILPDALQLMSANIKSGFIEGVNICL